MKSLIMLIAIISISFGYNKKIDSAVMSRAIWAVESLDSMIVPPYRIYWLDWQDMAVTIKIVDGNTQCYGVYSKPNGKRVKFDEGKISDYTLKLFLERIGKMNYSSFQDKKKIPIVKHCASCRHSEQECLYKKQRCIECIADFKDPNIKDKKGFEKKKKTYQLKTE